MRKSSLWVGVSGSVRSYSYQTQPQLMVKVEVRLGIRQETLSDTLPDWLIYCFLPRIPGCTSKFLGKPVTKALNSWLTQESEKILKPGT